MLSFINKSLFLSLVRIGIGHEYEPVSISKITDWNVLKLLADSQGLSAVVLDGIERQADLALTVPMEVKLEWIGEVLQNYEQRYKLYENAIGSLAGFYNQHGIKMMVLKGYACSLDWPKSEHRPCGDIDIWLFGEQKRADSLSLKEKGIKIDSSHHHHTVFYWHDFMVENHYDFINTHDFNSSKDLEVVFKELGKDDSHYVEIKGEKLYLPSPNLHALFLIRHLVAHFASVSITFRQILDWAYFVKNHGKEVEWEWLIGILKEYHMYDFYNVINAICVGDLGFDVKIFPNVQFDPALKDKVLDDILDPKWTATEPRGFFKRMLYKYRRWQGNAWKQEMCYSESRVESFFTGLWSHIITPKGS